MNRNEAIETLKRIYNYCEEIDWHLPPEEKSGYRMYPDYIALWKYLRSLPDDEEDDLK